MMRRCDEHGWHVQTAANPNNWVCPRCYRGDGTRFDETVRIYYPRGEHGYRQLAVGRNVRVDAYAVLSVGPEGVTLGDHVHLAVGVCVFGGGGKVALGDCCYASPRSVIMTSTDGMGEDVLVGPTVPEEHRSVRSGAVTFLDGAGIGTGALVLPGVTLGIGACVGALSIAKRHVAAGHVVVGPDQRTVRVKDVAEIERRLKSVRGER